MVRGSSVSVPNTVSIRSSAAAASSEFEPAQVVLENEPTDPVGDHIGEQIGLGRNEPVEGLGRNAGALGDVGDAGRLVAVRLELLPGGLEDQRERLLVRADLRATPATTGSLAFLNFDHNRFPNPLDKPPYTV